MKSAQWYQRYLVWESIDILWSVDNVPMGHNDRLSMIFLDQFNDYKKIINEWFLFSNMAEAKQHTWKFALSLLKEFPVVDGYFKWMSFYKKDKALDTYIALATELTNDPIYSAAISKFTIPSSLYGWNDIQSMAYANDIAKQITSMWYIADKKAAMGNVWKEALVRVGTEYNFKELIDIVLKNKMTDTELAYANSLFDEQDLKWSKMYYLLQMLEHEQPGLWAIVISDMAYKEQYALSNKLFGKYTDITPQQQYVIDQHIVDKYWSYLWYVNYPLYESLMHKYVTNSPAYKEYENTWTTDKW
jgi:hypothetical protein